MNHVDLQVARDTAAILCRSAGIPNSQIATFLGFAEESGARKAVTRARARASKDDKFAVNDLADQVGHVLEEVLGELRNSRDTQLIRDVSILVRILCVLRGELRVEFFVNRP
ncbi:MAG: hypothetical protein K1X67_10285 [Fimbriimonadaceae bacterium]|nr:hypothetical protein [Fimbriimonadaceae bacterium]